MTLAIRKLLGILPCAFLVVAPCANAETNEDLLRFIVAEHEKGLSAELDNYSYVMRIEGYTIQDDDTTQNEVRIPLQTRATVWRYGDAIDMTKEHNTVDHYENGRPMELVRRAQRLIFNGEMLMNWQDLSVARLNVFFKDQWDQAGKSLSDRAKRELVFDPRTMPYCWSDEEILLSKSILDFLEDTDNSENNDHRWSVETVAGPAGSPASFILHRSVVVNGEALPSMTVYLDATRHCIVTKCVFAPPNDPVNERRTYTMDHVRVGDAWFLSKMECVETENNEPTEKMTIIFESFEVLEDVPEDSFSLAAMNLPASMEVLVGEPGGKNSALMKRDRFQVANGALVPLGGATE